MTTASATTPFTTTTTTTALHQGTHLNIQCFFTCQDDINSEVTKTILLGLLDMVQDKQIRCPWGARLTW